MNDRQSDDRACQGPKCSNTIGKRRRQGSMYCSARCKQRAYRRRLRRAALVAKQAAEARSAP